MKTNEYNMRSFLASSSTSLLKTTLNRLIQGRLNPLAYSSWEQVSFRRWTGGDAQNRRTSIYET